MSIAAPLVSSTRLPFPAPSRVRPARAVLALAAAAALSGCVSVPTLPAPQTRPGLVAATPAGVTPVGATPAAPARQTVQPQDRAQRLVTGFTPALRCMDDKLFAAGVRDLTLVLDEVRDATQRVPVGAREMMTSAVSEMTRRSRAVRLSVIGGEAGGSVFQTLQQARESQVFAVLPQYTLRGSLTQMDEDVERRTGGLGVNLPLLSLRLGGEQRQSVLGFDAAMLLTDTQTLVPGVTSRNSTVLRRQEAGASDGQATLRSATATFALATARSEGTSQAARAMVELAAVELVGKLTRLPYWQCLGTPDGDPEVQREIEDWFTGMDAGERIAFVKERLRERRWYDGALDAEADPGFREALAGYRRALGLAADGPLDLAFFRLFVTRPVAEGPLAALPRRVAAAPAPSTSPLPTASLPSPLPGLARLRDEVTEIQEEPSPAALAEAIRAASRPLATQAPPLRLQPVATARGFALVVQPRQPGYAYCYAQDPATQAIRRVFPNRFQRDPRVEPGKVLALPGAAGFTLSPGHRHACVFAAREVYGDLPAVLRWGDFQDVKAASFEEIRARFEESTSSEVALVEVPDRVSERVPEVALAPQRRLR